MKEEMCYWLGTELIVTPNRCYTKVVVRIVVTGLVFLCLSVYLAMRLGDFWQLPLAIAISLILPGLLYQFFNAARRIHIPAGRGVVAMSFAGYFKRSLIDKNDVDIVENALNGKAYMAIANKNNPYGQSYQISPYLTNARLRALFNENILPVIRQQLLT
ncbi:hypothetical protein [Chitinophaga qingshengii]|uniref:YcxB family protein n=1 Tax=Chitinophaga qingshengii TaxID=1569794 RepID=A0ABR7TXV4_9BACT|nr:hypothetical protein [Chitinophaga qingshengii]MBC9934289.1 hypothetical protein [Chitinophaga qingshengii]